MRLFTGRACFTWINPSVRLDKYQLGPARSQSNPLLCAGNGSQIPVEWMKRKSASGSLPQDRSERTGWKSRGPSPGVDAGQGSLGEADGIIIHILSVLFISSTVSCFSSSCWEKRRDPYFWAGQITLSPLGDAAAFNIVCVCVCLHSVCVSVTVCFLSGVRSMDKGISCGNNNWPQHAHSKPSNQVNEFISFPTRDLDARQTSIRM